MTRLAPASNIARVSTPMPEGGFPLTIYMHGSGGEWYQAINRGERPEIEDAPGPYAGTGPAEWLARRGVATLGFDYPFHGDRETRRNHSYTIHHPYLC